MGVQPAIDLYLREYNILFIEVPDLGTDHPRWQKYGMSIFIGALRFLQVKKVSVLATGSGGCILLQMMSEYPHLLSNTHSVYNIDLPKLKSMPFEVLQIEEALRNHIIQIWLMFQDAEDLDAPNAYSRNNPGPQKIFDALSKVQARLEAERNFVA